MAIVNAIPELWSAGILRGFDETTTWGGLVTDVSREFAAGGDKLHLSEVTGTITVHDYVKGTPLADPEQPGDAPNVLTLDQHKAINIGIEDIERFQARPAVFEEWTRKAGLRVAQTYDRHVYSVYNTTWNDSMANGNRVQYDKTPTEVTATWRQGLVDQALAIVRRMDEANWPTDSRWCVITTEVKAHLIDYLVQDKSELGAGGLVDDALVNAAFSRLFGVRMIVDNQLPTGAAENNPFMLFGLPSGIYTARQIAKMEAYRPEKAFQDAIKGLFVYGAVEAFADRKFAIVQAA